MIVRVNWSKRYGRWAVKARSGAAWKALGYAKSLNVRCGTLRVLAALGGVIEGDLAGALWDEMLPVDQSRVIFTSWDGSDRRYAAYGSAHGHCVTYRQDLDEASWIIIGQPGSVWDGSKTRVKQSEMLSLRTGGIQPNRRGNVFAFDPCDMPA